MHMRDRETFGLVGGAHRGPELRQRLAARQGAKEEGIGCERQADPRQRLWEVVDRIERAQRQAKIVSARLDVQPFFHHPATAGRFGKALAWVQNRNLTCEFAETPGPRGIGAADQQGRVEGPLKQAQAIQAVLEKAFEQEQFGPAPESAIPTQGSKVHVEQFGRHVELVRCPASRDKPEMIVGVMRTCIGSALDFALPPRCAGCGIIVGDVHSFCPECWKQVEFLGEGGCKTCGIPLGPTDSETCATCLARPPHIARTRAAVSYDDLSRNLAIRLKYARKVGIAKTMARYMLPLLNLDGGERLIVPVPLHRARTWWRGFNQSALVARELSRAAGIPADPFALRRIRRTPPLKGMSALQRRRTVAAAFRVRDKDAVAGRTVILVDDVLTTGSTAEACARALKRAGAARIELVTWARVVKPSQLMR